MNRYILLILIIIPLTLSSCTGRKSKVERKNLIPEKELVSILTDAYLADGLLSIPNVNHTFSKLDSLGAYNNVVGKYGYTMDQMNRTMRFYFIKQPKRLIKIYDKVLNSLSELEARLNKESVIAEKDRSNMWPGPYNYSSPDKEGTSKNSVNIPILATGIYSLRFSITIFPDDQSVNPRLGLYFIHTDQNGKESRDYFCKIPLIKDGRPHTFTLRLNQNDTKPVRLKGWFIENENSTGYLYRHFDVDNISLNRTIAK